MKLLKLIRTAHTHARTYIHTYIRTHTLAAGETMQAGSTAGRWKWRNGEGREGVGDGALRATLPLRAAALLRERERKYTAADAKYIRVRVENESAPRRTNA